MEGVKVLEEAVDMIEQQAAEIERLRSVLVDASLQIQYLHEKFGETGSGNGVLAQISDVLRNTGSSKTSV